MLGQCGVGRLVDVALGDGLDVPDERGPPVVEPSQVVGRNRLDVRIGDAEVARYRDVLVPLVLGPESTGRRCGRTGVSTATISSGVSSPSPALSGPSTSGTNTSR